MCVSTCTKPHEWRSEHAFQESVLSLHHVGSGDRTWAVSHGSKHLYPQILLTSSTLFFLCSYLLFSRHVLVVEKNKPQKTTLITPYNAKCKAWGQTLDTILCSNYVSRHGSERAPTREEARKKRNCFRMNTGTFPVGKVLLLDKETLVALIWVSIEPCRHCAPTAWTLISQHHASLNPGVPSLRQGIDWKDRQYGLAGFGEDQDVMGGFSERLSRKHLDQSEPLWGVTLGRASLNEAE